MEVTFKAAAYLQSYASIEEVASGKTMPLFSEPGSNYFAIEGYSEIGAATVVVEMFDKHTIAKKQLDAAQEELAAVRAENQRRENAILDKISKLQAIGYEPA